MSDGLIVGPGESANVKGVEDNLNSIGRGNADPIEGNEVVLTYSRADLGVGSDYPLSNFNK